MHALSSMASDLVGQTVLYRTDCISTYQVIASSSSRRNARLTQLARQAWMLCLVHNISLSSQYVGSRLLVEKGYQVVDERADTSDCVLKPAIFAAICKFYGPLCVDLFADLANVQHCPFSGAQLPFFSRFLTQGSLGIDAIARVLGRPVRTQP